MCYGSRDDSSGSFTVTVTGILQGLKLVHKSGRSACAVGLISRWGCFGEPSDCLSVYITAEDRLEVFYPLSTNAVCALPIMYKIPGYTENFNEIVLNGINRTVSANELWYIWQSEDWVLPSGGIDTDNGYDFHCVDVYANFYKAF